MPTLYCILARSAETGVIFRRGPSRQVRLIGWNLTTHTFQPGHWFKGRLYGRKSDLSPNGKKLIYFAAKYSGAMPTWIAVSTPPYLTAHVLWPANGTWNDLSMFDTDDQIALATYRSDSNLAPAPGFEIPAQVAVKPKPWPGYFHVLPDHQRLCRDGWTVYQGNPVYRPGQPVHDLIYRKSVAASANTIDLVMTVRSEADVTYALRGNDARGLDLKADWADVRGSEVLFSRGARLYALPVATLGAKMGASARNVAAKELADFGSMQFEAIETPPMLAKW